VDAERLWARHMDIAKFGATGRGGVNRQAFTPEDAQARLQLCDWARERGFSVALDSFANMFVRLEGREPDAAPVVTGSHLDTQPTGGNFDGVFGVLAGFEALEAIMDAGITPDRPIEVAVWSNEEGSRFAPSCMGSGVYAGVHTLEEMAHLKDVNGNSLGSALQDTLEKLRGGFDDALDRPFGAPIAAYVEAHIEQGPVLEKLGKTIGVVTGIQGMRWFAIDVTGEESHAGTTPRAARKDALRAAMAIAETVHASAADNDADDILRVTIGRFIVQPGSPNVVPGRVHFTIDLRHPEAETIEAMAARIAEICRDKAGPCEVRLEETSASDPVAFDPAVMRAIETASEALDMETHVMPSGAGHDAEHMAAICPTGMIFVPCERGLSHNEAESADKDDLAAGARVLAHTLLELAKT
jgi:N-carbamoyl-L-amino-acid hydrolase